VGSGHLPTQILLTTYIDDRKVSVLKNVLDVLDNYLKQHHVNQRPAFDGAIPNTYEALPYCTFAANSIASPAALVHLPGVGWLVNQYYLIYRRSL
jgi:hypothetical protein